MKLHWSPRSPFVRKVMIFAHETGLTHRLEPTRTVVGMRRLNRALLPENPLNKIPTLILDDGRPLYDSTVICEYLDSLHDGPKLFPCEPDARWTALRRCALGDGMLDFLMLWRNEREREHPAQDLLDIFAAKLEATLAVLESEADDLVATPFGIGHIALGCAAQYVDFRFADLHWRAGHPRLAAWVASFASRPSAHATEAKEG
jgi:glutathione S-transferase